MTRLAQRQPRWPEADRGPHPPCYYHRVVLLFWASTLLPGVALASLPAFRRRTGVLGAICWWFVLALAVHMGLTVVAFATAASVGTTAVAYAAVTLLSLVVAIRRRRPARAGSLAVAWRSAPLWIALAVVGGTLVFPGAARFDAQMHAAKILLQQAEGFVLQDPYSPVAVAQSAFHVNVMHVLSGIGVAVTKTPPLAFWHDSGPFFRLVEFGGVQLLAIYVLRSTFLSAIAVLAAAPLVGLFSDNAVPAAATAWAVLPAILLSVSAHTRAASRPTAAGLAVCAFVLPALHVGHTVMFLLCLVPVLLGGAAYAWRSAAAWRPWVEATALLVVPALPFLLITALFENHAVAQMGEHLDWELTRWRVLGLDLQTISVSTQHWILPATAATGAFMLMPGSARERFAIPVGALMVALQFMFNPFVFRAGSAAVPFWMFRRLSAFAALAGIVSVAGLVRPYLSRPGPVGRRAVVAVLAAAVVVGFNAGAVVARLDRVRADREALALGQEIVQVLATVPGRPLVAADPELSLLVPAMRPAAVMAPSLGNANPADGMLAERARARDKLLGAATSDAQRREVLARYGVDVVLLRREAAPADRRWAGELIAESPHLLAYRPPADLSRQR